MISGIVLLFIGVTVLLCSSAVVSRCLYGSAPDCYFPCNCADQSECEQGTCVSGCSSNTRDFNVMWSGPTCQIGNIAYQKDCRQSGASSFGANLAVDGRPQTFRTHEYCSQQNGVDDPEVPAWWVVDLGDVYEIYNITIYGRNVCHRRTGFPDPSWCADRLSVFTLRVGYPHNYTSGPVCADHNPVVPLGGHVTVTCNQPLVGTHVYFVRRGGFEVTICSICEVIVIGHRYVECPTNTCDGVCDEVTGCGSCMGAYRPDCTQACDAGFYGINCAETCGRCAAGAACEPRSGNCPGACQRWWADDRCQTEIKRPAVGSETARVLAITNISVTIEWDPLQSVPSQFAEFYKYRVKYGTPGESYQDGSLVAHGTSPLSYEVSGLQSNTVYEITVATYRVMGVEEAGGTYTTISHKTKCNKPELTEDVLTVQATNGTDEDLGPINVALKSFYSGCESITNIIIEYRHTTDPKFKMVALEVSATTYTIQPTWSGEHEVRIVVTNNEGLSATSQPQTVTVIETRTDPPTTTTTTTTTTTVSSGSTSSGVSGPQNAVAIAVPVVVVLLAAVGIGLGVFFWYRRRQKKSSDEEAKTPIGKSSSKQKRWTGSGKGSDNSVPVISTSELKVEDIVVKENPENIYANTGGSSVVPVEEFEAYVKQRKRDLAGFETEYKGLPKEDLSKCEVAQTEDNLPRNRYKNIYAYDENRVILDCENDSEPDYINANYITGFNRKNEYIATQGARNTTVLEFWRMIWQEKVNIIVMVANLVENGKGRCAEYWPQIPGGSADIENITITLEATESSADYTTSVLSVHKGDTTRTVRHFHFKTWEDKGNPVYGIMSLLAFYNKVHGFDNINKAPMVVHCSAGVGRTGTFIVLDILMQQAKVNKEVDVVSCVHRARTERMHMVQTMSQYYFLHDALLKFIKCGDTFIRCEDFERRYAELCPAAGPSLTLKQQFKLLREMITAKQTTSEKVGATPEHVDKNRDKNAIPANFARPCLPGLEEESYINAVFVDSFKYHDFYLATQLPLPHTVTDFWRLVHSQESTTVVMLNQPHDPDEIYWPPQDAPSQTYGRIHVTLTDSSFVHRNVSIRTFHVTKNNNKGAAQSPLVVKHFQLLSWPDDSELPPHPGHLLELRELVLTWHQQKEMTKFKANTIVQCLDGVSHSGLYCGVAYVLDKMKLEQVDPFMAVRFVSQRRPEFFKSLQQYQFLYKMAKNHMAQYSEYANVQ